MPKTSTARAYAFLIALGFSWALRPAGAASIDDMEPSANVNGTLGLGQIVSAEPMGQGRVTVAARDVRIVRV